MSIKEILEKQREYFKSGATLDVAFRRKMLRRLYSAIEKNEKKIFDALEADLGKSDFESYMCELGMTLEEISYMIKNIRKFSKKQRVRTPISQFRSKSYTLPSPYGNVLIMSPWNYPFLLSLSPLADAMAAGNTAILKPSAYSPATSAVVAEILGECFEERYIAVVEGGRRENAELLEQKFDLVFFTGSQAVGKEVLRKCAESLTPAVLELGGKSPCIVDESADIEISAKRIVFGKYLNCGQTCVAPDYILCHSSIKDELVAALIKQIKLQFGENPLENEEYGHIISKKHYERLVSLIDKEKTVYGGECHNGSLKIAPTVLDRVTWEDNIMQEEIFGPILPILTFDDVRDIYGILQDRQKPLALYVFSQSKDNINELTERLSFGGGCVNDTIIHLATSEMGFGGVGESGMGAYHGRVGFETFSHRKSIVNKSTSIDLPMRYQPYNRKKYERILRSSLK